VAGFVLANGSMFTNTSGEGAIRRKIIENDLVDCMIALPGQLFYTTQIPVCLWFLAKNKQAQVVEGHSESNHRDRQGETLFIDARNMDSMVDRTHKELTTDDIAKIARTYHAWRNESPLLEGKDLGEGKKTPGSLVQWARELRRNQTDAEKLMWQALKNRQMPRRNSADSILSIPISSIFIAMNISWSLKWTGASTIGTKVGPRMKSEQRHSMKKEFECCVSIIVRYSRRLRRF